MTSTYTIKPSYTITNIHSLRFVPKPIVTVNKLSQSKILPIPLVHKNLSNSHESRSKLRVLGHKYFSKIVVSSKESKNVLEDIQKSFTIKYIKTFEFDPHFCEDSCIKSLSKTLPRLRASKNIDLTIRRVSEKNETDILCPLLYRILRMKRFRIEFPGTPKIDEAAFVIITKALAKCNSLKSLGYKLVDVPGATNRCESLFGECHRKNPQIEELTRYFCTGKDVIMDDLPSEPSTKYHHNPKLRKLIWKHGISSRWSLNTAQGDACSQQVGRTFPQFKNLEELVIKSENSRSHPNDIYSFIRGLSQLQNLKFFSMSSRNSSFTLPEIMAFAVGVSKIPQLQEFTFKLKQNCIDNEPLIQLTNFLYALKSLKKTNIFFGKLDFSRRNVVEDLENHLPANDKINRDYSKQYVHLSW